MKQQRIPNNKTESAGAAGGGGGGVFSGLVHSSPSRIIRGAAGSSSTSSPIRIKLLQNGDSSGKDVGESSATSKTGRVVSTVTAKVLDLDHVILRLLAARRTPFHTSSYTSAPSDKQVLQEWEIVALCQASRRLFLEQPMLLELEAPVNIVGDIHGQFHDLLRHFDKLGYPPQANYLFLGDYVDRGRQSIETICLVMAYKIKYPHNFFLLRGNHECASINRIYGFFDECKRRYSFKLWKTFTDCFNCLPVAAVVESTIFCTHGGLSPELRDLNQIRSIQRPVEVPDTGLLCDLLWADPQDDQPGWAPNDRGVSWLFGGDVVTAFLKEHAFSLVVRAHQVVEDGYQFFQKRALVTIFSAPNYCGQFDNAAAAMTVSRDLTCSFSVLPPSKTKFVGFKGGGVSK